MIEDREWMFAANYPSPFIQSQARAREGPAMYTEYDQSLYPPELPVSHQVSEAAQAMLKMGLPREIIDIAESYRLMNESDPAAGGLYYSGSNTIALSPQRGTPDPQTAIHEAMHSFDANLTTQERSVIQGMIERNPPVEGFPARHHTVASGNSLPVYFDYLYSPGSADNRMGERAPTIPTEILQYIRELTPIIMERIKRQRAIMGPR